MRLPAGLHRQADDSIVCKHRDVSCCPTCVEHYEPLLDVLGQVYWIDDPHEREELARDCAELEAKWAAERASRQP